MVARQCPLCSTASQLIPLFSPKPGGVPGAVAQRGAPLLLAPCPPGPTPARLCPAQAASLLCLHPSQKHLRAVNLIKVSEKQCLGAPPGSAALNFIRSGLLLIMPAASLINNGRAVSRCRARRGKDLFVYFAPLLVFFFLECRERAGAHFPSEK